MAAQRCMSMTSMPIELSPRQVISEISFSPASQPAWMVTSPLTCDKTIQNNNNTSNNHTTATTPFFHIDDDDDDENSNDPMTIETEFPPPEHSIMSQWFEQSHSSGNPLPSDANSQPPRQVQDQGIAIVTTTPCEMLIQWGGPSPLYTNGDGTKCPGTSTDCDTNQFPTEERNIAGNHSHENTKTASIETRSLCCHTDQVEYVEQAYEAVALSTSTAPHIQAFPSSVEIVMPSTNCASPPDEPIRFRRSSTESTTDAEIVYITSNVPQAEVEPPQQISALNISHEHQSNPRLLDAQESNTVFEEMIHSPPPGLRQADRANAEETHDSEFFQPKVTNHNLDHNQGMVGCIIGSEIHEAVQGSTGSQLLESMPSPAGSGSEENEIDGIESGKCTSISDTDNNKIADTCHSPTLIAPTSSVSEENEIDDIECGKCTSISDTGSNNIADACPSPPLIAPTLSECTFQSRYDGSLDSFENGLVRIYQCNKEEDCSNGTNTQQNFTLEDECPQLEQAMQELEAFDWRSELISPVAAVLPERRRTDATELFLPGKDLPIDVDSRHTHIEDLSETIATPSVETPVSSSTDDSAFNWRHEIESPLLKPRIKRRKDSSLVPIPSKLDADESNEANMYANSSSSENNMQESETGYVGKIDCYKAPSQTENQFDTSKSICIGTSAVREHTDLDGDNQGEHIDIELKATLPVVRFDGRTILYPIQEGVPNILSTETFNCLLLENRKLKDQIYDLRKSHDDRIAPFREFLDEVSTIVS